jgi:hypothetical protein
MASHVLYVDDSGTKEYAPNFNEPDAYSGGRSRYFVFGGVLLSQNEGARLSRAIQGLKMEYFGKTVVEIKSTWLRQPKHREARYLTLLCEDDLNEFVDRFYDLVCGAELLLIAAVVDKLHMQQKYATPHYAPAVAYEVLLQRVESELQPRGGSVIVTIDDMSGATPKKNQYKDNLRRQHERLREHGSILLKNFKFTTLEGRARFVNSSQSEILQVADSAAYNVYRQFVDHGDAWEVEQGPLPTYPYFERISGKFRQDVEGRIQGFGVAKFPIMQKVQWRFIPDEGSKAAP